MRMIDGKPTRDMSGVTGMRLLRGAPGSKVSLSSSAATPPTPTCSTSCARRRKRRRCTAHDRGGVARVRVSSFGPTTAAALSTAFDKLVTNKTPGAVIDLRGIADGTPEDGIKAARLVREERHLAVRAARTGDPVKIDGRPRRRRDRPAGRPARSNGTATPPRCSPPRCPATSAPTWSASPPPASPPSRNWSAARRATACG